MAYYADYLGLDKILNAQELESDKANDHAHEEMLFIITHQAFELWFKQVLFELNTVIDLMNQPNVPESAIDLCCSRVQRVNKIMNLLCDQFSIMETMTPLQFMNFRAYLNPASGFQSVQWRILERKLGLQEDKRVLKHYTEALTPEHRQLLDDASAGASLFDVTERWLARIPFLQMGDFGILKSFTASVRSMLENDRTEVRRLSEMEGTDPTDALMQIDRNEESFMAFLNEESYEQLRQEGKRRMSLNATLAVLFITAYQDRPLLQAPFRLLEAIVELDRLVSLWRYRHTMMVSRMIGMRVGTGGSSGHDYLMQTAMRQRIFDDITSLSSYIIPEKQKPVLPKEIDNLLKFTLTT
jgi:tryptophan 2,3-dioxygenase